MNRDGVALHQWDAGRHVAVGRQPTVAPFVDAVSAARSLNPKCSMHGPELNVRKSVIPLQYPCARHSGVDNDRMRKLR